MIHLLPLVGTIVIPIVSKKRKQGSNELPINGEQDKHSAWATLSKYLIYREGESQKC